MLWGCPWATAGQFRIRSVLYRSEVLVGRSGGSPTGAGYSRGASVDSAMGGADRLRRGRLWLLVSCW